MEWVRLVGRLKDLPTKPIFMFGQLSMTTVKEVNRAVARQ